MLQHTRRYKSMLQDAPTSVRKSTPVTIDADITASIVIPGWREESKIQLTHRRTDKTIAITVAHLPGYSGLRSAVRSQYNGLWSIDCSVAI